MTGATPEQLFAFFDSLGIAHETVEHPPFFTVEEGRQWHDRIPGLDCKNLFIKDKKDKIWLILMPGAKRADLSRLEKKIGAARFSFGKPELLMEILKLTPGSVTPFGLMNDTEKRVTVIIDEDVVKSDRVNFHPLRNTASTAIKSSDLVKFIGALGYQPLVTDCGS